MPSDSDAISSGSRSGPSRSLSTAELYGGPGRRKSTPVAARLSEFTRAPLVQASFRREGTCPPNARQVLSRPPPAIGRQEQRDPQRCERNREHELEQPADVEHVREDAAPEAGRDSDER